MDAKHFGILKEKLNTARKLADIMDYFLDEMCADPEFFGLGARLPEQPTLEAALRALGEKMVGAGAEIEEMLMTYVPKHRFIHGCCLIGGKMAQFIFFEDIRKGLLAVAKSFKTGETEFARFTTTPLKGEHLWN
jgi:hypothetical protein